MIIKIILANPRGFCAGVRRAIDIVDKIIQVYGVPVYVRHELVHNDYVINQLLKRGVVFVNTIDKVPDGAVLVFSAHGVSRKIYEQARVRDLIVFDATCPLVTKVHTEVLYASRIGMEVILIGHTGHPEVEGIIGQYTNTDSNKGIYIVESISDALSVQVYNSDNLFFVTQTTFLADDISEIVSILRKRFPNILGPRKSDICYATFNRQFALKKLALMVDIIFVVGSSTSSNSMRLLELACRMVKRAYLVNNANEIQEDWLYGVCNVGITAGASAPDVLVYKIIEKLQTLSTDVCMVTEMFEKKENIFFNIPKSLMDLKQ